MRLFRNFDIGRKIAENHGLTPLLFGEIFPPKKFIKISLQNYSFKSKANLFRLNLYILSLFRQSEIDRKIAINHGLTPLLFCEIFRPEKITENSL